MFSVYKIKPLFQQLLKPLLIVLFKMGVSANTITLSSIGLSCLAGIYFWFHPFGYMLLVVPFVLLIRMALNALDGMMARTYHMQSRLGEMLNELGDVLSDLFLFFTFIKIAGENSFLVLVFLLLSVINEFAGVMGKVISGERRYDGPMGKSDRALFAGILCLLLYFWPEFIRYLAPVFGFAVLLLIVSTWLRLYHALKSTR
jgi:CDP-diacylglycerol--glycerol-3-phosphate 3-phosphatidyltransferase